MSRIHSANHAADTVWNSISDASIDPEPALDFLEDQYEGQRAVQERFCAQFYHMARAAYQAVDLGTPMRSGTTFAEAAAILLGEVTDVIDGMDNNPRMTDFYGIANELTPVAILQNGARLASRREDKYLKTDVIFDDGVHTIPIQAKTDDAYTIERAPKNGVLITASDYGNYGFTVSRAAARFNRRPNPFDEMKVKAARKVLSTCIYRRYFDRQIQEFELREKAAGFIRFKGVPTRGIRQYPFNTPEMAQIKADLVADMRM